ncbi:MAG: RNA pseudouridine synthase [Saprospiraceae bacterium]|nr:RNA pseudouridine synthase [Saprospiraceae bacterium]
MKRTIKDTMDESNNISDLVIYKNNQLLAINKKPGMSAQPDKTESVSVLQLAEIYCKHPVHLVHRLDRPASGVILFAKNKKALANLNLQFKNKTVSKVYWALVKNKPEKPEGTLTHFLKKNGKTNKAEIVAEGTKDAKEAILHYKTLSESDNYTLLEVELVTGRFHQIRAQLAAIGCPIKGDVKYGFRRSNPDRSIHLHARSISFDHPVTGERVTIEANPPEGDPVWGATT